MTGTLPERVAKEGPKIDDEWLTRARRRPFQRLRYHNISRSPSNDSNRPHVARDRRDWADEDGWTVVDWKTDIVGGDEWARRAAIYEKQVGAYADMFTALTGERAPGRIERVPDQRV